MSEQNIEIITKSDNNIFSPTVLDHNLLPDIYIF